MWLYEYSVVTVWCAFLQKCKLHFCRWAIVNYFPYFSKQFLLISRLMNNLYVIFSFADAEDFSVAAMIVLWFCSAAVSLALGKCQCLRYTFIER